MVGLMRIFPLVLLAFAVLSGCSRAPAATMPSGPVDAVRVGLPTTGEVSALPDPAAHASWSGDGHAVRYGAAGTAPLLVLECRAGQLAVTRNIPAEIGAQALFALQGPSHILRLPVDATAIPGQRGYVWKGSIAADDPRLALFGSAFNGTLPGGGMIKASGSSLAADLIRRCRAELPRGS
ncbi:hypothetical protein [Novosphingobium sp.]|uniref:hypothetical protein n=1 Tax=Novosphingobium sp. TaxID=1874826 RepID=UPI0038B9B2D3